MIAPDRIITLADVAEFVAGPRVRAHPGSASEWAFGDEWRDEATTRAGLLEGRSAPTVARYCAEFRKRFEAVPERIGAGAGAAGWSAKRRRRWAEQGDEADVDRVLADRPDCWRESVRGRPARVVRLGVNIAMRADGGPADFGRIVGAAAAAADVLTVAGYGVEVTAARIVLDHDGWHACLFPLKRADEPVDVERLGSIGTPGALRCFSFRWVAPASPALPPRSVVEACGLDALIGRGWDGEVDRDVFEAVRRIVEQPGEPAGV